MLNYIALRHFTKIYRKPVILLMGAPGVGKGTYGKRLSLKLNMPIFSTGEYFREIIKNKQPDPFVDNIRNTLYSGKLIDDQTMRIVLEKRLFQDENPNAKGVIFDGTPRTLKQALEFNKLILKPYIIFFHINKNILIEKLLGRRECEKCRMPYNLCSIKRDGYDLNPLLPKKNENHCDICNGKLIKRVDDTSEIISKRLMLYHTITIPMWEMYKKQKSYIECEPKRGVKDYPDIEKLICEFLQDRGVLNEIN